MLLDAVALLDAALTILQAAPTCAATAAATAESAMFDAVALLDSSTASKAEPLVGEFLEYLDAMDYNKYFDAMPTRTVSCL